MDVKTEAHSNDMTECSHDDKPTVGMFSFSLPGFFVVVIIFFLLVVVKSCSLPMFNQLCSARPILTERTVGKLVLSSLFCLCGITYTVSVDTLLLCLFCRWKSISGED